MGDTLDDGDVGAPADRAAIDLLADLERVAASGRELADIAQSEEGCR